MSECKYNGSGVGLIGFIMLLVLLSHTCHLEDNQHVLKDSLNRIEHKIDNQIGDK